MPAMDSAYSPSSGSAVAAQAGFLSTLCYQSRAPNKVSAQELDELLADARERNKRFGVTGMLVHEGDRFFQWLEGPRASLNTLWTSISHDERHAHIELLGEGITPVRLFSDWDLKFHERGAAGAETNGRTEQSAEPSAAEEDFVSLARLALGGDHEGMMALVAARYDVGDDQATICRNLFESAARQLGDWWCEDVCNSFDITLALGRLQSLVRRADTGRQRVRRVAIEGRRILVSPPPREPHLLGTTLLQGFFHGAGWSVQAEFPQDDPELMGLVSTHWFDALALTLSDVFTRRERLAALIETIKDVRAASRNPNMAVIVGGRAFGSFGDQAPEQVGADVHYGSAGQAVGDLDFWLFKRRLRTEAAAQAAREERASIPAEVIRIIAPALRRGLSRDIAGAKPASAERGKRSDVTPV